MALSGASNSDNNREYNLYLTEEGQKIYNYHLKFEEPATGAPRGCWTRLRRRS